MEAEATGAPVAHPRATQNAAAATEPDAKTSLGSPDHSEGNGAHRRRRCDHAKAASPTDAQPAAAAPATDEEPAHQSKRHAPAATEDANCSSDGASSFGGGRSPPPRRPEEPASAEAAAAPALPNPHPASLEGLATAVHSSDYVVFDASGASIGWDDLGLDPFRAFKPTKLRFLSLSNAVVNLNALCALVSASPKLDAVCVSSCSFRHQGRIVSDHDELLYRLRAPAATRVEAGLCSLDAVRHFTVLNPNVQRLSYTPDGIVPELFGLARAGALDFTLRPMRNGCLSERDTTDLVDAIAAFLLTADPESTRGMKVPTVNGRKLSYYGILRRVRKALAK